MSEPARPLSRRERRALEEAAQAAEGEVTQALPVAPETESIMSRRERRRLERLTQPLETWTREEELIATGQMPPITPEVIAEQERLARERAEAAYAQTEPEPEPVAVVEPEPQTAPEPSAVNEIPADLRHLFPPGSLQARAFEAKQQATAPAEPDAVDEIRRLTQEAMAGITRANASHHPNDEQQASESAAGPVAAEPVAAEPAATAPEAGTSVPDLADGIDVEELWRAPTVDEPVRAPLYPEFDAERPSLNDVPLVAEVPVPQEPATHASASAVAPVWESLVPATPASPPAAQPAAQPAIQPAAQPATQPTQHETAPSMWDTHPLTHPGVTPVRELPVEAPRQELPRPDLSALLNTQANPSVGQQVNLRTTEPLTTTGAMPQRASELQRSSELQRLTEPHPGGGARHFRWAHLAVIGAIAFVLGVLAWNVARSGS